MLNKIFSYPFGIIFFSVLALLGFLFFLYQMPPSPRKVEEKIPMDTFLKKERALDSPKNADKKLPLRDSL